MRKILFFLVSLTIGMIIFGIATSKVGFDEIINAFSLFSWQGLIVVSVITFFIALTDIWKLKFILKTQGHKLSYFKTAEVWLPGFAMSYLTPFAIWGGEFIMIYILKKKFNIDWEKGGAAIFIFRVVDATIFFPFLISGVLIFPFLTGHLPIDKVLIAGGVVTSVFIFLLINFYIKSFKNKSILEGFLRIFGKDRRKIENTKGGRIVFNSEKEIIKFFTPWRKEMWLAIGNSLIKYFLVLTRICFLIFFFQGGLSLFKALAVYGFFNLSCVIPIPAQLGVLEASEAIVFEGLGLGANVGIAFSFILRAMDFLICFIGIIVTIKIGFGLIKRIIFRMTEKVSNHINHNDTAVN